MAPALIAAFALVCLGFPSYDYYFDGLTFAMAVEGVAGGGNPAWLLHPHHLLYSPAAYAAYRLAGALGLGVRAWLVMQWLSTLCAVAGLALFHRILLDLGVTRPARLAGIVMLGASFGWWRFATQGDTTLPSTVLLIVLLSETLRPGTRAVRLGLVQAAAILLHQAAVVFLPGACWGLWTRTRPKDRKREVAVLLGTTGAVSAAAYLAAGFGVLRVRSPDGLLAWMSGYFGADPRTGYAPEYAGWAAANLGASARGWWECWFGAWPGPAGPASWGWHAAAGICAAAILALAVRAARRAFRADGAPDRRLAGEVLLVWLAAHAAFFTWWKPGHTRFWVLALPGWALLAVLGAEAGRRRGALRPILAWVPAIVLVVLVGTGPFRRESSPACNPYLPVAAAAAEATPPDATIVISGVGEWAALKAYLPYFAGRRMLILDWQFADKAVPRTQALAALKARLGDMAARGRLYILSEALDPRLEGHFRTCHGVGLSAIASALPRQRAVTEVAPGLSLSRVEPGPRSSPSRTGL
jgi:hypothetical protein